MAKKVGKIAKEKKPFDKTYIPLTFAFIILALLVGALVYTIIQKPKDKPVAVDTNTIIIEDLIVNEKNNICSNDELKDLTEKAKKLTAEYEEISDYVFGSSEDANSEDEYGNAPVVEVTGYALRVSLKNGSQGYKLEIINNRDDDLDIRRFYGDITEINWEVGDTLLIRKYNVKVYSDTDSCQGVLLREFEFSIPKWNEASKWPLCNDPLMAEDKECKHFTMENRNMMDTFDYYNELYDKKLKEEKNREKEEQKNKGVNGFIKDNIIWIIILLIVIVIGVIVFIIMKGRKKNESNK